MELRGEYQRILLSSEVDIYKESYEQRYEEKYEPSCENLLDSNVHLPYEILRITFRYLSGKDLGRVAIVCRSWSKAAKDEKYSRRPYCFLKHYAPHLPTRKSHVLRHMWHMLNPGSFTYLGRLHESLDELNKKIIKPSIGFFILPTKAIYKTKIYEDDIKSCICKLLPQNCEAIVLFTCYKFFSNHPFIRNKMEYMCALLSQIPNVKISMIKIIRYEDRGDKHMEFMQMIEGVTRRNDKTSTCLMFFCNWLSKALVSGMAYHALTNDDDERIASVWGGAVNEVQYVHADDERFIKEENIDSYAVALLITGSIQTWSVVLDGFCTTTKEIKKNLRLFQKQVKLQEHSVAFMFTGEERQYLTPCKNINLELNIFKALFPEVPVVTCIGKSAMGINTNEKNPFSDLPYKFSELCTAFMILTYC